MSLMAKVIRATTLVASMLFLSIDAAIGQHEEHQHTTAAPRAVEFNGTVVCADGPALPGAIIQLFGSSGTDNQVRASGMSDVNGRFQMRVPAGSYRLRVTFLGHANAEQLIDIGESKRVYTVGTVTLQIAAVELEAIVAAAEQDRLQLQAGYTVVDATRNGTTAGGSVADVLRTVPNVEIDAEGRVSIRGSSSVLVLINGRRAVLKDEALAAFLKQMPASSLDKIEVSTTASAKQDAEGFAGVVNLEFRQGGSPQGTSGYSVAGSAATAGQFMASASAAGGSGALSWNAAYAASTLSPRTYSHTMRDNFFVAEQMRTSHQESDADARHKLHALTLGSTAQLSARVALHADVGYTWMKGTFANVTNFAGMAASGLASGATTVSRLEHTIPTAEGSLGWTYRDPAAAHLRWTSEVRYAAGDERFGGRYRDESGVEFLATVMEFQRREIALENNFAFDLALTRVEVGHKSQVRWLAADYTSTRMATPATDRLEFDESVNGFYTSLSRVFGPIFVQAGLRAELGRTELALTRHAARDDQELRWFPSVALHWPHEQSTATQFQLAYGRRIQRPDAAALNPFAMGEDDMNSFIGNPLLQPEITDQLELSVVKRANAVTLQASPYVRVIYQPVRPIKAITASGQATTMLRNLDRSRLTGMDVNVKLRWHDRVSASLSSNLFYASTKAADLQTKGWYYSGRGSVDVKVLPNTTLQVYAYRRSAQPIEQGEILAALNSELAITHRFGSEQRGSLTLRASDPFDTSKLAFHLADSTFTQHSERKITSRMLSVFVSWTLGGTGAVEETGPREEPAPRIF